MEHFHISLNKQQYVLYDSVSEEKHMLLSLGLGLQIVVISTY